MKDAAIARVPGHCNFFRSFGTCGTVVPGKDPSAVGEIGRAGTGTAAAALLPSPPQDATCCRISVHCRGVNCGRYCVSSCCIARAKEGSWLRLTDRNAESTADNSAKENMWLLEL